MRGASLGFRYFIVLLCVGTSFTRVYSVNVQEKVRDKSDFLLFFKITLQKTQFAETCLH